MVLGCLSSMDRICASLNRNTAWHVDLQVARDFPVVLDILGVLSLGCVCYRHRCPRPSAIRLLPPPPTYFGCPLTARLS